ncbi:MAG TPA: HAD family hydrolase [Candidatus Thermoplasmatota archaeon]|nr:HAD family hydrolase [Candidatus Thermoplasmatota archaeon]
MIETAILDLDGTLLDIRARHHGCYSKILVDNGRKSLSPRLYWAAKRRGVKATGILAMTNDVDLFPVFQARWLDIIERPEWLAKDVVFRGVHRWLEAQDAAQVRLVVATHRRDGEAMRRQFADLGLDRVVKDTIVCPLHVSKAAAVKRALPRLDASRTVWIGDTEADLAGARGLGCRSWLLTCGLRNREFLKPLAPDGLFPKLTALPL